MATEVMVEAHLIYTACARAAAKCREEMSRGLGSLAIIASLAPLVGVFGTVIGIVTSFRGISGERSTSALLRRSTLLNSIAAQGSLAA